MDQPVCVMRISSIVLLIEKGWSLLGNHGWWHTAHLGANVKWWGLWHSSAHDVAGHSCTHWRHGTTTELWRGDWWTAAVGRHEHTLLIPCPSFSWWFDTLFPDNVGLFEDLLGQVVELIVVNFETVVESGDIVHVLSSWHLFLPWWIVLTCLMQLEVVQDFQHCQRILVRKLCRWVWIMQLGLRWIWLDARREWIYGLVDRKQAILLQEGRPVQLSLPWYILLQLLVHHFHKCASVLQRLLDQLSTAI